MSTANAASLCGRLDDCLTRFDAVKRKGKVGADTLALIKAPFLPLDILVAVFPGRTTRKTGTNSSIPPSQMERGTGSHDAPERTAAGA